MILPKPGAKVELIWSVGWGFMAILFGPFSMQILKWVWIQEYLTTRASLAPRLKHFLSQGPKGPLQELEVSARYGSYLLYP